MESDKKLTSLESEVKIVKGEVKALLIDIREIMNNMENPFYNTQGIAGGPDTSVGTKVEPGGDAPGRSVQPEDMLEQEPEREHHPDFVEMPVQHEGMQPMGAGHTPNVAETPMQQGMPMPQIAGYAPNVAETPVQQGMPMPQMGGTPEPYHPGFAEMPVQHDGTTQEATPEHVPGFAEMFKQYEEAKQSEDDGTKQEATPEPAPDFAEMFKQYEGAKQSEEIPEETLEIQPDNGFDIHTLAELMRWTDYTLKTIERSRLDELLDLCVLTGHISEVIKDTVSKIADLSAQEVAEGSTSTMQDHIAAMFQLNAVLNPSESDQKAIYSIYGELPWRTVG